MIHFYWLILGILCVWRITHLFQAEDGPWDIIIRIRKALGNGFWGELLDCFYCLSLWVSVPFAYFLGDTRIEQLLLWPALSAGAILVERLTNRDQEALPAPYIEEKEDTYVLR
jgi:hypothetical protein